MKSALVGTCLAVTLTACLAAPASAQTVRGEDGKLYKRSPIRIVVGVQVQAVYDNSAAMSLSNRRGGNGGFMLQKGEVITHVNGKEVKTVADLSAQLKGTGQKRLTVVDNKGKQGDWYVTPRNGQLGIQAKAATLEFID